MIVLGLFFRISSTAKWRKSFLDELLSILAILKASPTIRKVSCLNSGNLSITNHNNTRGIESHQTPPQISERVKSRKMFSLLGSKHRSIIHKLTSNSELWAQHALHFCSTYQLPIHLFTNLRRARNEMWERKSKEGNWYCWIQIINIQSMIPINS